MEMFEEQIRKIARRPMDIKLLLLVGRGGVATYGQCFWHLQQEFGFRNEINDDAVNNYIVDAIVKKHIMQTDTNFDDPSLIIFHLTDNGHRKVWNFSEKLGDEIIYGQPNERRISSIRHDLVGTEGLLLLNKNNYIVLFENETILRSRNKTKYWENKKYGHQNKIAEPDSLPDFRIGLVDRENHRPWSVNCESAIKYKGEKITKKSKDMIWFTDNDYQLGKIETLTGCEVHLVNPLANKPAPDFDEAVRRALSKSLAYREKYHLLGDMEKTILDTLRETRMMMCVTDMQQFIKGARPAFERALKKLIKIGAVRYRRGRITSKANPKHPDLYYYLPGEEKVLSGDGFERHLILNAVNELGFGNEWRFYNFDPIKPALTLVKDENLVTHLPDYDTAEDSQSLSVAIENFKRFADRHPHAVNLAVVNKIRYEKLSSEIERFDLVNLTNYQIQES